MDFFEEYDIKYDSDIELDREDCIGSLLKDGAVEPNIPFPYHNGVEGNSHGRLNRSGLCL